MKFSFRKEMQYFTRTVRMFGVIFSIMIFGLADPLIMKGAQMMLNAVGDMAASSESVNIDESSAAAFAMLDNMQAQDVVVSSIGDFCTTASLIVLLVLMQPSGGEQKKRSIIIPHCAGLAPKQYITPKFIIYPVTAFVSAVAGMALCAGMSTLLFEGAVSLANALAAGAVAGVYIAFLITAELTLGICTEKPGVAAIVTILAGNLLPTVLALFRVDRFNPFALQSAAAGIVYGNGDTLDVLVSAGVSIVLGVIFYFLTLFVLVAKKIDNAGNEPAL